MKPASGGMQATQQLTDSRQVLIDVFGLLEQFCEPVDEGPHAWRYPAVLHIRDRDWHRHGLPLRQYFAQQSRIEVGLCGDPRRLDQPQALQSAGEIGLLVADFDEAFDLDVLRLAVDFEVEVDFPAVMRRHAIDGDVSAQIVDVEGRAVAAQIGRTCACHVFEGA
jgi:hypothetical protein